MKRAVGRPRTIETPEEFDALLEAYLERVLNPDTWEPVTLTGLVLSLGFSCKQSLYEYGQRPEFTESVKRARLVVEHAYELNLRGQNAAGVIFALKNMDWSDKQELALGNADDKPFEVNDTSRASRLAGLVAMATQRKGEDADGEEGEAGDDLC